ncbi:protein SCO1/2 [Tenacibaculum sp. MAR_2009_124]|uniref:SCO family protein n=1 Tax=Tenacibaculum sp. MAR_2009_124 TaxID=1250059 RepID=UPI00089ABFAC|nr:SCO family protein [Tenacibaculum sp. MAR_2009_124]SEB43318.1 protein SCO1/2 [Tenacibaculum sp. MAR_2009_124]
MRVFNRLIIVIVVLTSCKTTTHEKNEGLPYFNSAELTPEWISRGVPEYNNIHKIPNFEFINQEGDKITQESYDNKIYVADFFFTTCPGICPMLERNMSKLQDIFGNDDEVLLLSHSVTPLKDSVSVLKEYAKENGIISSKWNVVTGNKDHIYDIARNGYFADEDFVKTKDASAFIHTENFVLVDKEKRIRGVYNGTLAIEIERLVKHIKMLKRENNF